eukprot:TRINITY_DN19068_c0_g1_i1.p1 TRINITY_DN19068_c0_g1~~TRINITY_DN19068_c0_g1_i1.p1  ORF type:complete len:278 (-),score=55.74 TRINITY_DN19068_c0_g1_i1:52-885(-)
MESLPVYMQPATTTTAPHRAIADGVEICGWTIQARKRPILSQPEIEQFSEEIGLQFLPEMLFGNNGLSCAHSSGLEIKFFAFDALQMCLGESAQKEAPVLAGSEKWGERGVVYSASGEAKKFDPYDWTFSTKYQGSLSNNKGGELLIEATTEQMDTELLKRTDPIRFYEDVVLYEDELHDNGVSMLNVRVRVMPTCFLVLLRHWLRVDMVFFRCYETRIFHKYGQAYILRDYQERQAPWETILGQVSTENIRDPNLVYPHMEMTQHRIEKIHFPSAQ